MPCSACAKKSQQNSLQRKPLLEQTDNTAPCSYTSDITNVWLNQLECIDSKGLLLNYGIQRALYNSFLGILISIKRNPSTVCYFNSQLDIIQPYILNIINSNICQDT